MTRRGLVLPAPPTRWRDMRRFYVALEGEKAEPCYFEALRARHVDPRRVALVLLPTPSDGAAASTSNILHVFERLKASGPEFEPSIDERWLVADRDPQSNKPAQIAEVAREAEQKKIGLAVSNPCFEVWVVAHDRDIDPGRSAAADWKTEAKACLPGYASVQVAPRWITRERIDAAIGRMVLLRGASTDRWPNEVRSDVDRLVTRLLEYAPAR